MVGDTAASAVYLGTDKVWPLLPPFDPATANEVTGGTVTDIDNFNGSGQRWRIHEVLANGNLTVVKNPQPFDVVLVGGGASGGANLAGWNGGRHGGAGGGGVVSHTIWGPEGSPGPIALPLGVIAVTRGAGSGQASNGSGNGGGSWMLSSGQVIGDLWARGGGRAESGNTTADGAPNNATGGGATAGAPGTGIAGQGTNGGNPNGGSGLHMPTRIRGVEETLGVGGGLMSGGAQDPMPGAGGRGTTTAEFGDPGRHGIVIVAYRIG